MKIKVAFQIFLYQYFYIYLGQEHEEFLTSSKGNSCQHWHHSRNFQCTCQDNLVYKTNACIQVQWQACLLQNIFRIIRSSHLPLFKTDLLDFKCNYWENESHPKLLFKWILLKNQCIQALYLWLVQTLWFASSAFLKTLKIVWIHFV